jgi:hypothetical protein
MPEVQAELLCAGRYAEFDHALPQTCPYALNQITGDRLP